MSRWTCSGCGIPVEFWNGNMVMLRDELWMKVSGGKKEDVLCDTCIEAKLGRPIKPNDFKKPSNKYMEWMRESILYRQMKNPIFHQSIENKNIICNQEYLNKKNKTK